MSDLLCLHLQPQDFVSAVAADLNTYSRSFGTMHDDVTNALSPVLLTDSFVFAPFLVFSLLRSGDGRTVLHRKSPEFLRIVQLFLPSCSPSCLSTRRERLIASPARVRLEGRKEEGGGEVSHFTVLYA